MHDRGQVDLARSHPEQRNQKSSKQPLGSEHRNNEAMWLSILRQQRRQRDAESPKPRRFPSGPLLPGRYWKDPPLCNAFSTSPAQAQVQNPAPVTPRPRHRSPTHSELEEHYSREHSGSRSPWRQWWAKPGYQWDYYESHVDEDGDSVYPRKVYFLNFKHSETVQRCWSYA